VTSKVKVGLVVALGGALAYYLWKSRGGARPVCGPGFAWHQATASELELMSRWSLPMQEMLKKWGGYCAKAGEVSEPELAEGPILYPWQVE
jgi:hypothetical protein